VLGPRLLDSARALLRLEGDDAAQILGPVDASKLRSSMTLFMKAVPEEPAFGEVLQKYFDGVPDERTTSRL
jgi:uncharacterized protein (DUF1810 family)